jgi:hypothetical protein
LCPRSRTIERSIRATGISAPLPDRCLATSQACLGRREAFKIARGILTVLVQRIDGATVIRLVVAAVAAALLSASCRDTPPARTPAVVWRPLGSWTGRTSMQTEPFISNTGSLRLRWETGNAAAPGAGTFRVTVHSDVSGRPLVLAVDARGVGRDTAFVTEDPRSFFLAVESAGLDWSLAADEGIAATAGAKGR